MKKIFAILIGMAIVLSVVVAFAAGNAPVPAPPDFTIATTDGRTLALSALLEEKQLVVLNLFNPQYSPSRIELPWMEDVYEDVDDRVEIVAVTNESAADLSAFRAELGLSMPVGISEDLGAYIAKKQIAVTEYPTTLFINRQGDVVYIQRGYFQIASQFRAVVDYLLSAPTAEAATSYNILIRDGKNQPVPGVVMYFYGEGGCRTAVTDADGVITFAEKPSRYHFQILSVPDGYAYDRDYEGTCDGGWVTLEV